MIEAKISAYTRELLARFAKTYGFGDDVIIDEFARTLPPSWKHYYDMHGDRASKQSAEHKGLIMKRSELAKVLRSLGHHHDIPFTLKLVGEGCYRVISPNEYVTHNRVAKRTRNFAHSRVKEVQKKFRSIDWTNSSELSHTKGEIAMHMLGVYDSILKDVSSSLEVGAQQINGYIDEILKSLDQRLENAVGLLKGGIHSRGASMSNRKLPAPHRERADNAD